MPPPPRLDQGANIGDIHDQRSGASTARDQIGTLRGIKSECLRAMVGIRSLSAASFFTRYLRLHRNPRSRDLFSDVAMTVS
jgi:hypothetical protein